MFKERLRELRKEKKLTQKEFADKFCISGGTIAMWETGRREPDHTTTIEIAKFFNVSVDYLLGVTDEKDIKKEPAAELGNRFSVKYDELTPDNCALIDEMIEKLLKSQVGS